MRILESRNVIIHHHIPGRMRISVPEIYKHPRIAAVVQEYFLSVPGVELTAANILTGRILVCFKPDIISTEKILKHIRNFRNDEIKQYIGGNENNNDSVLEPEDIPIKAQAFRLVIIGASLLFIKIKRLLTGVAAVSKSQSLLDINSIIIIASSYPVLQSGLESISRKHKINHDLLLGTASLVLLVLRQDLLGLWVLWLTYLSAYIQSSVLRSSERQLNQMILSLEKRYPERNENKIIDISKGQCIPIDGVIEDGAGLLDESGVTGSPIQVLKSEGDTVLAGSWLKSGALRISKNIREEIQEESLDTSVMEVTTSTHNGRLLSRYTRNLSYIAFALSAITFLLKRDPGRTMSVLLAASPSAASLSILAAYRFGLARTARHGVLTKKIQALEVLSESDAVLFDKTGTLTRGVPEVQEIIAVGGHYDAEEILKIITSCEKDFEHPVGLGIIKEAKVQGISPYEKVNAHILIGQGVKGNVEGKQVLIGNEELMKHHHINLEKLKYRSKILMLKGFSILYIALDEKAVGMVVLKEKLRKEGIDIMKDLRAQGVQQLGLITGDAFEVADNIGRKLGIDNVWGAAIPNEKAGVVKRLQNIGHIVSVVGDGINDIPALRHADIGVVMASTRSPLTIEAADMVIVDSRLSRLNETLHISRTCAENARQNLLISAGFDFVSLALAFGGILNPLVTTAINNISILSVLLNGSRILRQDVIAHKK